MDPNTGLHEATENQSEIKQIMEKDKAQDDIVYVDTEEANSAEKESLPTEPQHEQNGDPGPNLRNKQKRSPAYKRVELCIMDKVRVIAAGNAGLSQRQVAKQFGISKTQVQTLLKRKEDIMRCYNEGDQGMRKRAKFRRHSFDDVSRLVSKWYSKQGSKDEITGSMLKEKAMEISVELGLGEEFKASNGWLEGLKRRYDIQTAGRKSNRDLRNASATMVAMKRNQSCVATEMAKNCNENRNKEENNERRIDIEHENEGNNEARSERMNPTIHNVFSMQRPHPVIHSIHPVLLPSSQMFQQQTVSNPSDLRPAYPYPPLENNLQTLAEIVGQEATICKQIKSYSEALRFANTLKAFAVETGSVTLIGLMTAMEHELKRESRNSSSGNDRNHDIQNSKDA